MKIQLIDYNREMGAAYKEAFKDVPEVEVHTNSAFAIPTECIVSPANSFGFMDLVNFYYIYYHEQRIQTCK